MATNTDRLDQQQKDIAGVVTELARQQERALAARNEFAGQLARVEESLRQVQVELSETRTAVARQDERLKALEKLADHPAALASHDQRLKALERGTDRLWQFAPMVLSVLALLAVIVFGVLNATRK